RIAVFSDAGKFFLQGERSLGGRRSCGAAQQVAACLIIAARSEPRPSTKIVAQVQSFQSLAVEGVRNPLPQGGVTTKPRVAMSCPFRAEACVAIGSATQLERLNWNMA